MNIEGLLNKTPLHHAVERGHGAVAQALIDAKTEVNFQEISRQTPLHVVATVVIIHLYVC